MPRDGAITFGDLVGKLDVLRVACSKCGWRRSVICTILLAWRRRLPRRRTCRSEMITMRLFCAALILLTCSCAASAEIRITKSHYEGGKLIVTGETKPAETVTLDKKYKTKSDANGHFQFNIPYKPPDCMTDIRAGEDIYSAVISGCFGVNK